MKQYTLVQYFDIYQKHKVRFEGRFGSFGNERPKRSGRLVLAIPKVGASLEAAHTEEAGRAAM